MSITRDDLTGGELLAVRALDGVQLRAAEADGARVITGIGVPYGTTYETPYFRERFERGAIEDDSDALAFFEHRHPIGRLTASRDTDAGREVTLTLSRTATADEAYTLAQDQVIRGLSIGFVPIEWREEHDADDDRPMIVHTRVKVREFSLVAFPAYDAARVSTVRSSAPTRKETPTMDPSNNAPTVPADAVTRNELDAATASLSDKLEDLRRSVDQTAAGTPAADGLCVRAAEWDAMGDWVQAIADDRHARHDEAMTLYRDVTTADVPSQLVNTPGFIGDLSRRITERRRWVNRFRSRPLPSKGMSVDYIRTEATAPVAEQTTELEALANGAAFSITPGSSPVRTFGGAETVSRQVIDRSEAWALTAMFEAFALQYARQTEAATKAYAVAELDSILSAGEPGTTVDVPAEFGAFDWIDAVVDSSGILDDKGYTVAELAVSPDIFKRLAAEAGTDGRPLLTVSGTGVNTVGDLNLPAASGELLRVPVTVLHGTTGRGMFYDPVAIETLESPGAPFWLQQDQVLNLSRDFACYGYLAHITPHPGALLPVNFTAAGA